MAHQALSPSSPSASAAYPDGELLPDPPILSGSSDALSPPSALPSAGPKSANSESKSPNSRGDGRVAVDPDTTVLGVDSPLNLLDADKRESGRGFLRIFGFCRYRNISEEHRRSEQKRNDSLHDFLFLNLGRRLIALT